MEELESLKRILQRERKARKKSEVILEEKSFELYQANQELKGLYNSLEIRYKKIIEQANDIIYSGDANGFCIFVNSVVSRILGYSTEEVIGKHFTELVTEDKVKEVLSFYLNQTEELIESSYYEFTVKSKSGEIKWLGQNVSLIIEGGEVIGTSAVARDITDQKQSEELVKLNELKYRSIIENMELGLLEVDTLGIVVSVNSRFTKITGFSESDLIGKDPTKLLTDAASKNIVDSKTKDRKEGNSSVYELKCKKKNGELIWLLISGAPRFNKANEFMGSIGIHMDITEQKQLLNQLETAKALAEQSSSAKETFLAHMSHEIRTPLNSVLGMTHLLQETNPTEEQEDYLETIRYSSEILLNIISDILDISKIEAGKVEFNASPFNLVELVRVQHKTFTYRMKEQDVDILLDLDPRINMQLIGDKLFINQIIMNLLANASKFTPKGYIRISLKKEKEIKGTVFITLKIEDSGIGIASHQLEQIFESFKQLDRNINIGHGGTGLGLSIAKHLVELHGGKIKVESKLNVGTKFEVSIPFEKTSQPLNTSKPKENKSNHRNLKGLKILVAEDNLMNQKFLSTVLEKNQIDFTICDNGKQSLEQAKKEEFDLVLMDIQMPLMNGYETAKEIRKLEGENRKIPIIALTASALVDERKKALEAGMNDHLSKPFSPKQLIELIESILIDFVPIKSDFDLDKKYLSELYAGDIDFKNEMLHIFLKNIPDEMAQLKVAIRSKNNDDVLKIVHKNKSSFLMAGLGTLETTLRKIETLATKDNGEYIKLAEELLATMPSAIISVEKELNKK